MRMQHGDRQSRARECRRLRSDVHRRGDDVDLSWRLTRAARTHARLARRARSSSMSAADARAITSPAARLWRRRRPSLQKVSAERATRRRFMAAPRGFGACSAARASIMARSGAGSFRSCMRAPSCRGWRNCRRPSNGSRASSDRGGARARRWRAGRRDSADARDARFASPLLARRRDGRVCAAARAIRAGRMRDARPVGAELRARTWRFAPPRARRSTRRRRCARAADHLSRRRTTRPRPESEPLLDAMRAALVKRPRGRRHRRLQGMGPEYRDAARDARAAQCSASRATAPSRSHGAT